MDNKLKLPLAIAMASAVLVGCSSNKVKEAEPNPLPKLVDARSLVTVSTFNVSSTNKADPLRLQLDENDGVIFILDPKGEVSAYQGKQRLWQKRVSKQGLSSGVESGEGIIVVGNQQGQLFALDQATGEQKWVAKLSGAILSPSLIQSGRVITIANDGTIFAHDAVSGTQVWTYKLPNVQFSLRGQPAPVLLDSRTVLVASASGYVYALDVISGVPRFQRRVAVSDGRSDIQRLIDIDGDPVVAGPYLVTTSFQGQVTATDLESQQVVWSEDASSTQRPEVSKGRVFVTHTDGRITAYQLNTGEKLWETDKLLNRHLSNPVVLDQYLIVGDFEGVLHLIHPTTGKIVGRSKTNGEIRSLRVLNGQLFVATRKGALSVWQNR